MRCGPALLIALLPLVAACGGGASSPTSPTTTTPSTTGSTSSAPAPPPSPTAPSNFGVFTFSFDAGTSLSDQALIGDAVQIANDYFGAALGRTLSGPMQIRGSATAQGCAQGGSAAFTGAGVLTVCMANQGWTTHGPVIKRKIVIHEVYHLLQFERRWLGLSTQAASGAMWMIEGVPELLAYKALDSRGLLPYTTARGCQIKEYTDFGLREPPGLPNLSALESPPNWNQTRGPLYALAMTGVDQLVTAPGLAALNSYMDGIAAGGATPFQTAFQQAFGQTAAAFYDQFPAYRASLPVPGAYQCQV